MKIDLKRQVKAAGYRRSYVELPRIEPTKAQETQLAKLYIAVVRVWSKASREGILSAYRNEINRLNANDGMMFDNIGDIEIEIDAAEREAVSAVLSFRSLFREWADSVQLWHMRRFVSSLKYATNVDLSTQLYAGDTVETIEDLVARNVALVRNVSDQARGRISDIVFRGVQNRTPARDVARELREAIGLSRDRSLRIAIDQSQKLSSALDKERQLQVGMTSFRWMHSGKRHYRPEHLARDGKIFSWDSDVAKNDPPGYAPFCGCKARGVLDLD